MAIEQSNRMQKIVRVAEVRKQRLANAAADARRSLSAAELDRDTAAEKVHNADATLRHATNVLMQNPATDQMLIWRNHCETRRNDSLAQHVESKHVCVEAEDALAQSLRALNRQDLRHDHLAEQAKQLHRKLARVQEARADDETQGGPPRSAMPLLVGPVSR